MLTVSIIRAISKPRSDIWIRYWSRSDKAEAWPEQWVRGTTPWAKGGRRARTMEVGRKNNMWNEDRK
jgi:hypothetical protein